MSLEEKPTAEFVGNCFSCINDDEDGDFKYKGALSKLIWTTEVTVVIQFVPTMYMYIYLIY